MDTKHLRNVAIIAHVDHGKTTLVDGLLKQALVFRENEAAMGQELIMDSNDLERERGITILSKNTAVHWEDYTINIIDTPGHADFGGEVERVLNMADGALLIVDAAEGPMPQTKFVLKKALEQRLKIIVVVNKIDKPQSREVEVVNQIGDLFLELATEDAQLDFPVLYAVGREAKAWDTMPDDLTAEADLQPIYRAIVEHIPAPDNSVDGPFQMLVTSLDFDDYKGKYAMGRIHRGIAKPGLAVSVMGWQDGQAKQIKTAHIETVWTSLGIKRISAEQAIAGDIVSLTGISGINIGETICDASAPEALPAIAVEEPTLKMTMGVNTSPFAGREGKFVTSRQLQDRLQKELETNVALRMEAKVGGSEFLLSGRGELHLSILVEQLRRDGFEIQVGKPEVIVKQIEGKMQEPVESLTIDVPDEHVGAMTQELGLRKGNLITMVPNHQGTTRLEYTIATRGLLGLRNRAMTLTKGTAVVSSIFLHYQPVGQPLNRMRNGVLIASEAGMALTYGLNIAQGRGATFIGPGTQVYEGMIVGLNSREDDLTINVTKEKKQSNVRSSSSDMSIKLAPPVELSIEQSLDMLEADELLEVTPKSLRLRKRYLNESDRRKHRDQ
jgi:GTP-binding protein